MEAPLTESNSLPELAARVRAEHTAVADALKDSLRHAITAGELLIVAKAQVPHGQWFSFRRRRHQPRRPPLGQDQAGDSKERGLARQTVEPTP
jgi:hypothetical protein